MFSERGQVLVEARVLKHDAEALADFVLLLAGSRPSISSVPLVGASSVVSILMVVVLPAPFGPRKAKISPGDVERDVVDGGNVPKFLDELLHANH